MKLIVVLIPLLLTSCNYRCFYDTYDYATSEYVETSWYGKYDVNITQTEVVITGRDINMYFCREKGSQYLHDENNVPYILFHDGENIHIKKLRMIGDDGPKEYVFYNYVCRRVPNVKKALN